jgi:hypothetical protein
VREYRVKRRMNDGIIESPLASKKALANQRTKQMTKSSALAQHL